MFYWIPIFIFEGVMFGFYNSKKYKRWFNYANCFVWLWYVTSIITTFGFFEFVIPTDITYVMVSLMTVFFEFGVHFGAQLVHYKKKPQRVRHHVIIPIKIQAALFWILNMACTIYMIPYVKTGLQYIAIGGFDSLRQESLRTTLYSTMMKITMADLIQPIILVTVLICIYSLIWNRIFYVFFIISIINAILYILIFAGRWIIVEIIMIVLITVVDRYRLKIGKFIISHKVLFITSVFAILGIIQITNQRNIQTNGSFLSNVYSYFIGSLHLFGVYAARPSKYLLFDTQYYLWGSEFFSGILDIIFLIINRLTGSNLRPGITVINQVTQNFVAVSSSVTMNNNVTMLYAFLRDGGIIALMLESFTVGLIYSKVEKIKNRSLSNSLLWVFMRSLMLFLLFEWMYARSSMIMVIIMIYIMTRKPFVIRGDQK